MHILNLRPNIVTNKLLGFFNQRIDLVAFYALFLINVYNLLFEDVCKFLFQIQLFKINLLAIFKAFYKLLHNLIVCLLTQLIIFISNIKHVFFNVKFIGCLRVLLHDAFEIGVVLELVPDVRNAFILVFEKVFVQLY